MRLRHVAVATVLALAGTTLVTAPASARVDAERRDGDHGPVSIDTTVPPGGTSTIGSPPLKNEKKVEVTVEVQEGATAAEKKDFDRFQTVLAEARTKGEKLLICIRLGRVLMGDWADVADPVVVEDNVVVGMLAIAACLESAGLINQASQRPARAARTKKCTDERDQLPFTLEQTDNGTRLTADPSAVAPAKKLKVKVSCKTKKGSITYTVKPKKKGQTLKKVVGKRLSFGILSPPSASGSVPLTVTFD